MPKIYTKTGDKGQTSLLGGKRVSKTNKQVEAYGTIDELNAHIGMLIDLSESEAEYLSILENIQSEIFSVGSHLALNDPGMATYLPVLNLKLVKEIEEKIDIYTSELPELKNFILPGGSVVVSQCHICRTVCRRAERVVVACISTEKKYTEIIIFLNRLSDFLFVLGRFILKQQNKSEKIWVGKT